MDLQETCKAVAEERAAFRLGTRVTNCVVHGGPLTERPDDCGLCLVDLRNQLQAAVRVNEFCNGLLDRIEQAALVELGGREAPR